MNLWYLWINSLKILFVLAGLLSSFTVFYFDVQNFDGSRSLSIPSSLNSHSPPLFDRIAIDQSASSWFVLDQYIY